MMADKRSDALIANFLGQWLYLRNLKGTAPDEQLFPDFDDNLRQAFEKETSNFSSAASCARIKKRRRSVERRLHFRPMSVWRAFVRNLQHLRQPVP